MFKVSPVTRILPKSLVATRNIAYVWPFSCMLIFVLNPIDFLREFFTTKSALEPLHSEVEIHMVSCSAIFICEFFVTAVENTIKPYFSVLIWWGLVAYFLLLSLGGLLTRLLPLLVNFMIRTQRAWSDFILILMWEFGRVIFQGDTHYNGLFLLRGLSILKPTFEA